MITVQISENTPYEALMATSVFIKQLASIYHPTVTSDLQPSLPLPTPDAILHRHAVMQAAGFPPAPVEDDDDDAEVDASAAFQQLEAVATPAVQSLQVETPTADLDVHGLPWDERIHSSSKAKTKTGEWKARRNVPDVVVRQVEAELRNRVAAPATQATSVTTAIPAAPKAPALVVPVAPVAPAAPVAPTAPVAPVPPAAPVPPVAPVAPVAPAAPAAPVAAVGRSHAELTALITKVITASPLKQAAVLQAVQAEGFANVPVMINAEPEAIGRVYARIEGL